MGISDHERISMIHSAVMIQITRATDSDRRTDGRTDGLAWHIRAMALSRVKTGHQSPDLLHEAEDDD